MSKIQNNFLKATINKDLDERLTPNGQMIDASNVMVISEDSGGVGVLKNVKGNVKVTSLNIANAETIGSISDDAKERCFYFVTSPTFDYVIQYNLFNNTTEIVLQSTHGTGVLNFDSSYRISHSDMFVSVEGDDLLSWTDGLNPPRIINIERAKDYAVDGFTNTEISVMKPSPIFSPIVSVVQSVSDDFAGFIRDKFLTFAYRYKYEDGFYSAFSSWSPYAFIPGPFQIDLDTSTNIAMQNTVRAYSISFNTGSKHVVEVELVFKISNSNLVYSITKLNKEEEGWSNNFNQNFLFNNYKVFNVLSEDQYFRSFDNVPLTALTQAKIGNRLVYGNYIEGRDIDSKIDLSVSFDSAEINTNEDNDPESVDGYDIEERVDFWGVDESVDIIGAGDGIVMDFATNVATISNTSGFNKRLRIPITIEKEPEYSEVAFDVRIYVDATLITKTIPANYISYSFEVYEDELGLNIFDGDSVDVYLEAESSDPVLFKTSITFQLQNPSGAFEITSRKAFDTDNYYQLAYNEDGEVPRKKIELDFSDIPLKDGTQIAFNFDFRTAFSPNNIVPDSDSAYIFLYQIIEDYDDLEDFTDDSDFYAQLDSFVTSSLTRDDSNIPGAQNISLTSWSLIVNTVSNTIEMTIPNRNIEVEETGNDGVLIPKTDYVLCNGVFSTYSSSSLFTSMHSSRDYEIGIVFLDKEGRKTTVLDSKNNGTYIPAINSTTQNVLKVTPSGTPPSWAEYYKFAVKYNRNKYETIYSSRIYNVGIYTYVELVADNKNKIKEGDYLVVKSDLSNPLDSLIKVKVLEAKFYDKDEIEEDSASGFYFKIKVGAFDLVVSDQDNYEFLGPAKAYLNDYFVKSAKVEEPLGTAFPIEPGYVIRFVSYCNRSGGDRTFFNSMDATYLSSDSYPDFREFFEEVIASSPEFLKYTEEGDTKVDWRWVGVDNPTDGLSRTQIEFKARTSRDGKRNIRNKTDIYITTSKIPVFETVPVEVDNNTYIETPKTYKITNGEYQFTEHRLTDLFNCYCFGNGVESISVRDEMNTNFLNIDYGINAVSEDEYRQVNRYADLTYSGVYQEGTNVNRLNEFNLSLANYKDDLDKSYGPIIRLDSDDTDILVIQEDRWSKVLYGKDLLYNTDATTNLSRIEDVLGQQVMYSGEYGISFHPESYDDYGTNSFCTDTKKGIVLGYNQSNGLTEISSYGMRDYFKTLFRDNKIVNIIGKYDSFFDNYIVNIKYMISGKNYTGIPYDYVTWLYSPEANGFIGRHTFNPDDMLRVNNDFLSFKGSDVYKHNIGAYNTFYGGLNPCSFEFNFNEQPSTRKIFKNVSIEGNSALNLTLKTDLQNGIISSKNFKNKEGVYYGYIRGNDALDLSTLAVCGIGTVSSIVGNNVFINGDMSSNISIGDSVFNDSLLFIGTITNIGSNFITLSSALLASTNMFLLSSKPSSVETSGIRGYYMNVKGELTTNSYLEVYALNSEVIKSFE
jgi:hypothetical protein